MLRKILANTSTTKYTTNNIKNIIVAILGIMGSFVAKQFLINDENCQQLKLCADSDYAFQLAGPEDSSIYKYNMNQKAKALGVETVDVFYNYQAKGKQVICIPKSPFFVRKMVQLTRVPFKSSNNFLKYINNIVNHSNQFHITYPNAQHVLTQNKVSLSLLKKDWIIGLMIGVPEDQAIAFSLYQIANLDLTFDILFEPQNNLKANPKSWKSRLTPKDVAAFEKKCNLNLSFLFWPENAKKIFSPNTLRTSYSDLYNALTSRKSMYADTCKQINSFELCWQSWC